MTAARLAGAALAVFLLDRATKWLVVDLWSLRERLSIDLWPGVAHLRMAWNRGVNFGLLASDSEAQAWGLAALAVVVSSVVAVWALRRGDAWFGWAAGALIGGALGNAWDRVTYPEGAVADFLNLTCCGFENPYAFNVADVAIFAGAAALVAAPSVEPRRNAV